MHARHTSFESALIDLKGRIKQEKPTVVSLDVFDTLILRRTSPQSMLDPVANWFDATVEKLKLPTKHANSLSAFHLAYQKCAEKNQKQGLDHEALESDLFQQWVSEYLGNQHNLTNMPTQLLNKMVELELDVTEANPCMESFLRSIEDENIRLIYISDMYLPKSAVERILEKHNLLRYFSNGYVSADFGLNKRSGNLFKKVIDIEGITPRQIIHLGDNKHSDGKMAAHAGMTGISVKDTQLKKRAKKIHWAYEYHKSNASTHHFVNHFTQSIPGTSITFPEQYAQNIWAPIYTSFVHNVIEKSISDGVEHLYFLARDGYLFYEIYNILAKQYPQQNENQPCKLPGATYLGVSRMSSMFFPSDAFGTREASLSTLTELPTILDAFSTLDFEPSALTSIA